MAKTVPDGPQTLDPEALQYDPDNPNDEPANEYPDPPSSEEDTTAHPDGAQFQTPSQADRVDEEVTV